MTERLPTAAASKPLPYGIYIGAALGLGLAGLIVSAYLAASHYWVYTDINHRSFCAISNAINCDTVSESPYSIWWKLPVPIWGVFGYAGLMSSEGVNISLLFGAVSFIVGALGGLVWIFSAEKAAKGAAPIEVHD